MLYKQDVYVGMVVRLSEKLPKPECQKNREDNDNAKISAYLPSIGKDVVMLDQDLHGRKFWNLCDLEIDTR